MKERTPSPICDKCDERVSVVSYVSGKGDVRNLCRECDNQEEQVITSDDVGKLEDIL